MSHFTARRRTVLAIALVLSCAACCPAARQPDGTAKATAGKASLQEILAAWRARETRFKTMRIEWEHNQTYFKHTQQHDPLKLGSPTFPEKDTTLKAKCSLLLDKQRSRFHYDGAAWFIREKHGIYRRDYTIVFNGDVAKSFKKRHVAAPHHDAVIDKKKRNFYFNVASLRSASLHFRPLSPAMGGFRAGQLLLTGESAVLGDDRLLVVGQRDSRFKPWRWKLWVDPRTDFAIRRAIHLDGRERTDLQIDIDYEKQPEHGWVVKRFKNLRYRGEQLVTQLESTVTRISVNPPVSAADFDIKFPPGTWVTDLRGGDLVNNTEKGYIIKDDGSIRPITRKDVGASYEQLLNSEPGKALPQPPAAPTWWRLAAIVLATAVLTVLVWTTWRRQSTRTTTEEESS